VVDVGLVLSLGFDLAFLLMFVYRARFFQLWPWCPFVSSVVDVGFDYPVMLPLGTIGSTGSFVVDVGVVFLSTFICFVSEFLLLFVYRTRFSIVAMVPLCVLCGGCWFCLVLGFCFRVPVVGFLISQ
jgi:hypothetical protein